ncbi:MAG: hypothetical protein EZS28_040513 [Streblomastix strix]|uniref:Uncharacterized protein n=1 Tax=Streblomastix strix TaxID=222440 RepID=A0A5J4U1B9_9EUKA|nr:MAG: hypothetical protein EZS28_040513 [Streblomastix strix]
MSFGKDISSELSNKRLFFLHYCPGHTRIDDIKECFRKIDKSSVSLNDRDNIEGSDVGCADVEFYDDADDCVQREGSYK